MPVPDSVFFWRGGSVFILLLYPLLLGYVGATNHYPLR